MLNRRFLLDSSALILYFMGENEKLKSIIENEEFAIHCSILSLFEVSKYMLKKKIDKTTIDVSLDIMRRRFGIVELTEDLCIKAARNSVEHDLYAIDSILYTSAVEKGATFVTSDSDFAKKKIKNVLFV